jgi:molybdopterin converting factor small subunit
VKIHVEYMSQLRTCTGRNDEVCNLAEGTTVEGLLIHITERYGEAVRGAMIDDAGVLAATVLCFVASEQVDREHTLVAGDVVTLITPISGG